MINRFMKTAAFVLAVCFSMNSFAGVITDVVEQRVKLSTSLFDAIKLDFDSLSYRHDINDDGFNLGTAMSAELAIDIRDDADRRIEVAIFTVEEFDLDTGSWNFGQSFSSNLEVKALAALNADGFLDVTVTALGGDFWVGNSTLTVMTKEVPEPATLSLLGLGLIGLAYSRRRLNS